MFINHYKTFNVWNSNNSEIIIDKFDDHFQVKYCFFFICKFRISLIYCDLFILEFYSSWLSCRAQVTNLQELYSGLVLYWGQSTNTCHHLYGLCNLQVRSIAHVHYTCIKNLPLEIWVDINLMNWYSIIQSSRTCHNSCIYAKFQNLSSFIWIYAAHMNLPSFIWFYSTPMNLSSFIRIFAAFIAHLYLHSPPSRTCHHSYGLIQPQRNSSLIWI